MSLAHLHTAIIAPKQGGSKGCDNGTILLQRLLLERLNVVTIEKGCYNPNRNNVTTFKHCNNLTFTTFQRCNNFFAILTAFKRCNNFLPLLQPLSVVIIFLLLVLQPVQTGITSVLLLQLCQNCYNG